MTSAAPTPDAVRDSRMAALERLLAFGMAALTALDAEAGASLSWVNRFCRLTHWMRLAMALIRRLAEGAVFRIAGLHEPRRHDPDVELAAERPEREEREDSRDDRTETGDAYLDRPFGEVLALICKGLGMTPDWAAWSCEPWAQLEIHHRTPASPYSDPALEPEVLTVEPEPDPPPNIRSSRRMSGPRAAPPPTTASPQKRSWLSTTALRAVLAPDASRAENPTLSNK